jgi:hypothetical protein
MTDQITTTGVERHHLADDETAHNRLAEGCLSSDPVPCPSMRGTPPNRTPVVYLYLEKLGSLLGKRRVRSAPVRSAGAT